MSTSDAGSSISLKGLRLDKRGIIFAIMDDGGGRLLDHCDVGFLYVTVFQGSGTAGRDEEKLGEDNCAGLGACRNSCMNSSYVIQVIFRCMLERSSALLSVMSPFAVANWLFTRNALCGESAVSMMMDELGKEMEHTDFGGSDFYTVRNLATARRYCLHV